jgi:Trk K+ transport system NAD-binding subunit
VYDPQRETIMAKMGLKTVCPTTLAVARIKSQILNESPVETLNIHGTGVSFRVVRPQRRFLNKSLGEVKNESILGIIRNGTFSLLTPKTVIEPSDMLVVAEYAALGE